MMVVDWDTAVANAAMEHSRSFDDFTCYAAATLNVILVFRFFLSLSFLDNFGNWSRILGWRFHRKSTRGLVSFSGSKLTWVLIVWATFRSLPIWLNIIWKRIMDASSFEIIMNRYLELLICGSQEILLFNEVPLFALLLFDYLLVGPRNAVVEVICFSWNYSWICQTCSE